MKPKSDRFHGQRALAPAHTDGEMVNVYRQLGTSYRFTRARSMRWQAHRERQGAGYTHSCPVLDVFELTFGGCKYQARKLLDLALTPKERAMFTAMGQL